VTRYHGTGFERGTGFYINPVMPEDAARILREGEKAEPSSDVVGGELFGQASALPAVAHMHRAS